MTPGVWSAPGRVNLIGEHTDYNDGFVLPFAIDRRTRVTVTLREDGLARVTTSRSEDVVELALRDIAPGAVEGWAAYALGAAWGVAQAAHQSPAALPGFEASIDSDVPVGSGLSSSAALECAVAVALNELWGTGLDRGALVRATSRAENEVVGAPTGTLDQSASLYGQRDSALFIDCRTGEVAPVPLRLSEAGLCVVVVDTKVEHSHTTSGYRSRREACERAAATLGVRALRDVAVDDLDRVRSQLDDETFRRVRHVVTEDQRVLDTVELLRSSGPAEIGPLLVASHESLRDDYEVSVPELDLAVSASLDAGALGARMTGGGFGGSAIALVSADQADSLQDAVHDAFASRGLGAPETFVVRPSHGAQRDDAHPC